VLHSLVAALPDVFGVGSRDVILPAVPMFHANAWGLPYAAALAGAALVLPGPQLDPENILGLLSSEHITLTAGVPTLWMSILKVLDAEPERWDLRALRRVRLGGASPPRSLLEGFDRHGIPIDQGWGMTETSPLGTVCLLPADLDDVSAAEQYDYRMRQGAAIPLVELRARGEDGELIPWDDQTMGELEVRGPWVAAGYLGGVGADRFTDDGWLRTGDIVRIDHRGCIRISDRAKDLVKSGGEWISSVDLENRLMNHFAVAEAAVIAIPDDRWGERPLAAVVLRDGMEASPEELREHLGGEFAKWQIPERVEFVAMIPRTASGKFINNELRRQFS
ncbi:MAG: AMP-binding protein, partial [Solirubrobacteraceae bacterium]